MELDQFDYYVDKVLSSMSELLKEKNRSYGGSAVNPLNLFTNLSVRDRLLVRIEDKLKRIETLGFSGYNEDNLQDLVGYFIILKVWDEYERDGKTEEDSLCSNDSTRKAEVEEGNRNGRRPSKTEKEIDEIPTQRVKETKPSRFHTIGL